MTEVLLITGLFVALVMVWVALADGVGLGVLRLDSWARVEFDFRHYHLLRNRGLTHKAAIRELDRMWNEWEQG